MRAVQTFLRGKKEGLMRRDMESCSYVQKGYAQLPGEIKDSAILHPRVVMGMMLDHNLVL